jgi:hypothetical protein
MREAMTAKLQAFAADSFDAQSFLAPPADAPTQGMRGHLEALVKVVGAMTPALDATQREKLALRLEQGPPRLRVSKRSHQGPPPADR